MMNIHTKIGEHRIQLTGDSVLLQGLMNNFRSMNVSPPEGPDLAIHIEGGYGEPFAGYEVSIRHEIGRMTYRRADYRIESDSAFKNARIFAYDALALKHALINLYSSYIVNCRWGLLIHSSCVIDNGQAHMFAGPSGAGKSTVARLSYPRELLSDEATLVKISPGGCTVYNSPFRSELEVTENENFYPLAGIHLLNQAPHNKKNLLGKSTGLIRLMDKVFYWSSSPEETGCILGMLQVLARAVPIYDLHFQKDSTFWELIS